MPKPGDKLYRYSHNDHKIIIYTYIRQKIKGSRIWLLKIDATGQEFYYDSSDSHGNIFTDIKETKQRAAKWLKTRLPFADKNYEEARIVLDSLKYEIYTLEADIEGSNTKG